MNSRLNAKDILFYTGKMRIHNNKFGKVNSKFKCSIIIMGFKGFFVVTEGKFQSANEPVANQQRWSSWDVGQAAPTSSQSPSTSTQPTPTSSHALANLTKITLVGNVQMEDLQVSLNNSNFVKRFFNLVKLFFTKFHKIIFNILVTMEHVPIQEPCQNLLCSKI